MHLYEKSIQMHVFHFAIVHRMVAAICLSSFHLTGAWCNWWSGLSQVASLARWALSGVGFESIILFLLLFFFLFAQQPPSSVRAVSAINHERCRRCEQVVVRCRTKRKNEMYRVGRAYRSVQSYAAAVSRQLRRPRIHIGIVGIKQAVE